MENPIINIKIAIRELAKEGVPVKKLIDATKEAEGILESYDEGTRKEIYGFLNRVLKDKNVLLLVADRIGDNIPSMIPSWIAYLEKQKELAVIPDELVKNYKLFCERGGQEAALLINAINGLNKQKEQKPAEWSEEDEVMLNMIEYRLKDWDNIKAQHGYQDDYNLPSPIKWLKSLRPQPHWKPSEEQMEALKEASANWMNEKMGNAKILESLYEQLKKL